MRDGLSILDQVLAGGDKYIDREKVLEYVGTTGEEFFIDLTELVSLRKSAKALLLLNDVLTEGKDVKQIMKDWVSHYRSLLITKFVDDAEDMLNMSAENLKRVSEQSRRVSVEEIDYAVTKLSKTINDARWSTNPRVLLELAIVSIASDGGVGEAEFRPAGSKPQRIPETPDRDAAANMNFEAPAPRHTAEKETKPPEPEHDQEILNRSIAPPADANKGGGMLQEESYGSLWHSIFEEGEDNAGSFNLIRSGSRLHHVGDDNFTVVTGSSFTLRYVEQKRPELEKLMEKHMGRPMKLICRLEGDLPSESASDESETEKIAREAEELLGINIEIE